MTQYYIGFKQVEAWEQEKDGAPGYAVRYPDGYQSWSPKEVFEAAYLPMGHELGVFEGQTVKVANQNTVTPEMVHNFIVSCESMQLDEKTTHVKATLANGFVIHETSSCVDPARFDMKIGEGICRNRIENQVWKLLGFLLQTARFGVAGPK